MDGTLVDNCAWHVKAWRAFAVRHGREITEREILEWMGAPSAYYMNRIFDRAVPPDECAALTREKESLYRELYAPHLKLPDGLGDLLGGDRGRVAVRTRQASSGLLSHGGGPPRARTVRMPRVRRCRRRRASREGSGDACRRDSGDDAERGFGGRAAGHSLRFICGFKDNLKNADRLSNRRQDRIAQNRVSQ